MMGRNKGHSVLYLYGIGPPNASPDAIPMRGSFSCGPSLKLFSSPFKSALHTVIITLCRKKLVNNGSLNDKLHQKDQTPLPLHL